MEVVENAQRPQVDKGAFPAPFIVGTGRSGTTLLRMMLDAHSELAIPPETEFRDAFIAFQSDGIQAAIPTVVEAARWGDFGIDAEEFIARARDRRPDGFGDVMRALYELYAERMGKARWGDKSPYNAWVIAIIYEQLPEARFVHVVRDGRDVALSMLPLWFGPDNLEKMAQWWARTIETARQQAEQVPFYKEVQFETLVREPARTLREVCDFLELDWEPEMLDYHFSATRRLAEETVDIHLPERVVSREERRHIHRLLGHPPREDRLERWRKEMTPADRRAFEQIAGDTLRELGYEVEDHGRGGI